MVTQSTKCPIKRLGRVDENRHSSKGRILFVVGVLVVLHSAMSMQQFVQYLKQVDDVQENTPSDIVIESVAGLLLCLLGAALWAGPFKPLFAAPEFAKIPYEARQYRPSFFSSSTRAKRIAQLRTRQSAL